MKIKIISIANIILLCVVISMGMYIIGKKDETGNETHIISERMENFIDPLFSDAMINMNLQESNIYCMCLEAYCDAILTDLYIPAESNELDESDEEKVVEEDEIHAFYDCVENPIDSLFSDALINARAEGEISYRMCQELYYNTWKSQYETIMQIIRKKCKYEEDIENYDLFVTEIEEGFDRLKPLILNEMLDNYDMPESPEKHSYGNGTNYRLLMYQGTMYRNACMFFVPFLSRGDYSFPEEEVQAAIAEILGDS